MTTLRRQDRIRSWPARLEAWARDARELATCCDCYGVGEDRDQAGRACPTCAGAGRAAREPHVLAILELLREADRTVDAGRRAEGEGDELRREIDRLRVELYQLRDERQAAARRLAQLERALPVWPTRSALTLVDADDDDNDLPSATVQALREAALQLAADRAARLGGDQ